MNQLQSTNASYQKRTGLMPARIGSTHAHKLGVKIAIAPPTYAVARNRHPTHVLPGAKVYLTVESLEAHPEHPEHRRWVCCHAECRGQTWTSKEDLVAAHPTEAVMARDAQVHVFYAVLEVPPDGPRPASVCLLADEG